MAGPPSGTIGNIVSGVFTPVLAILDDSPTIWLSSVSWKGPRAGETDHLRPPARTQRQSVSDLLGHVPVAAAAMKNRPGKSWWVCAWNSAAAGRGKKDEPFPLIRPHRRAGGKDPIPTPSQLQASSQTIGLRFSENLKTSILVCWVEGGGICGSDRRDPTEGRSGQIDDHGQCCRRTRQKGPHGKDTRSRPSAEPRHLGAAREWRS